MTSTQEVSAAPVNNQKPQTESQDARPDAAIHYVEDLALDPEPKVAWSTILAVFVSSLVVEKPQNRTRADA
jgi:hypothetical protein